MIMLYGRPATYFSPSSTASFLLGSLEVCTTLPDVRQATLFLLRLHRSHTAVLSFRLSLLNGLLAMEVLALMHAQCVYASRPGPRLVLAVPYQRLLLLLHLLARVLCGHLLFCLRTIRKIWLEMVCCRYA